MDVNKFRLDWRNSPQKQLDFLEAMVGALIRIDDKLGDISIKLDVLPDIKALLEKSNEILVSIEDLNEVNNLLTQQVVDNTTCTCNALHNVEQQLDEIIDLLNTDVPAYSFDIVDSSFTLTDNDLVAGSFLLNATSVKNGANFDGITVLEGNEYVSSVEVLNDGTFRLNLAVTSLAYGTYVIRLQQAESSTVEEFNLIRVQPTVTKAYLSYSGAGGLLIGGDTAGEYQVGVTINLPTEVWRQGYSFLGFVSSAWSGTKQLGETFIMPAANTNVAASWKIIPTATISIESIDTADSLELLVLPVGTAADWSSQTVYLVNSGTPLNVGLNSLGQKLVVGDHYSIYYRKLNGNGAVTTYDIPAVVDGGVYSIGVAPGPDIDITNTNATAQYEVIILPVNAPIDYVTQEIWIMPGANYTTNFDRDSYGNNFIVGNHYVIHYSKSFSGGQPVQSEDIDPLVDGATYTIS
ncbi:hypothetical protein [Dysgonomonas macrotermitis]|uniref:Uncharacterized protein n=1 Tax=Dysgonomonas macrotermitis TaxID=1346286 RepID=A0A1M4WYV0_9BACT|nr:hypothetical protein [Dysgonomonas macrotermitis]SHE86142.1 hypothetical protein SAMN05444362_102351 [Dysgonomonas macrotermitis]